MSYLQQYRSYVHLKGGATLTLRKFLAYKSFSLLWSSVQNNNFVFPSALLCVPRNMSTKFHKDILIFTQVIICTARRTERQSLGLQLVLSSWSSIYTIYLYNSISVPFILGDTSNRNRLHVYIECIFLFFKKNICLKKYIFNKYAQFLNPMIIATSSVLLFIFQTSSHNSNQSG